MAQSKTTPTLLLASLLLLPGIAMADSFEDAVNEYLKGFKECTEANTLRTKDLNGAKKKFDTYLKTLDKATAMDSSILSTTQRDMDKNLRYCERVELDIKRAEATPILEKGFTYCDAAKTALDSGDVATAQTNLDEYKRYRDDAFIITETIMEVFAMASKVRACSRVEEKLAEASLKESAVAAAMTKAATDYQSFLNECTGAKTAITSPKFSLNSLDAVNQQLNNAMKFKKAARENGDAFATMSAQPERPESQSLKKLVDSATACEGEVSGYIRTATKNKRGIEKEILDGTAVLKQSMAACESSIKSSERFTDETDLTRAEADFNSSASLKRKITSNSKLIASVQQYPDWKASQEFSQLMNSTESCQTRAAASIKNQKSALSTRQQKAKDDAARQAKLEEERKRLAEEQARKDAEAVKQKQQAEAAAKKAEEQAKKEAAEAAKFEDVDVGDIDEDLGSLEADKDKEKGSGKSWTDLVK